MKINRLALNLSKTSIQLLKKGRKKTWYVLGSVDPSSKNLEKDLCSLRNQAAALSTKKPLVDILLPRELVLSQTIVIEDDFSIEHCKKVIANRCGLNENEILIAIGDSSTKSTIPIAAISANSITESRNFVKKAGFRPERYIASSKISGFKKSPVFLNDNSSKRLFDIESKTYTQVLALTSIFLFVGFLISLASAFVEYRSNNKPYNYLAEAGNFNAKENSLKTELTLLREAQRISPSQLDISIFERKDSNLISIPQKAKNQRPQFYSISKFSMEAQLNANLKTTQIKELRLRDIMSPISIPEKLSHLDDLKELSNSQKVDSLSFFLNQKTKPYALLPKIYEDFQDSTKERERVSKKLGVVSNSFKSKRVFASPKKEKRLNHTYKKIVIEEIFSDISLTKILITTSNKRTSTLPLLFLDIKKPDIFTPEKLTRYNSINDKNEALVRPNGITREESYFSTLISTYENDLSLNHQFAVKLKEQGINIKLLKSNNEKGLTQLALWNGNMPTIKPRIIDSIKVLEDPTKSTGAVTFVELPPEMPPVVSKLKKVAASTIRNLNVRSNPPSIPKRASIVGNSTLKNLIELNRTNLLGIFGKRSGRVALIRLSSGNMVKVKVGQQFGNGWRVISIDLDKIHITNGSRQETLRIPG